MVHRTGLLKHRVSVIDLGSNSIKLVNYELNNDRPPFYWAYRQEGIKVKLGRGLTDTGRLGKGAMRRTIEALRLYRDKISLDQIETVFPVATSAVREAENKDDFLNQIYNQTGFRFRVLSGAQEALYSFIGASKSIFMPTALFFDIGGGSLELVYVENQRIKNVKSCPLGALRLSQIFGRKDGTFSRRAYNEMEEHILKVLPSERELNLSPDTQLVGVGGSLRALARFNQEMSGYELTKIHNYKMDYLSILSITRKLAKTDVTELSEIKAIGANRMDTIAAGSLVISLVMRKLGFSHLTVSTHGLREGILSMHMNSPRTFYSSNLDIEKTQQFLIWANKKEKDTLSDNISELIESLVTIGLLREREKTVFAHAMTQSSQFRSNRFTNLSNLFYVLVDEDNAFLSHREQLIMALSIIHAKKEKTADWLFSRHGSILDPKNKGSIEKISACLALSEILESIMARAKLYPVDRTNPQELSIRIIMGNINNNSLGDPQVNNIPSFVIADALRNFERAFNISIASCHVSFFDDPCKQVAAIIDLNAHTNNNDNTAMSISNAPD